MAPLINLSQNTDLTDFTIVIPSVCIGNVGQLTVDLMIPTYSCKKVGTIWHPAFIPVVGSDPYSADGDDVCTACDIYTNEELKLALIQIRSGIDLPYALSFFKQLKDALSSLKVKNVLILTSSASIYLSKVGQNVHKYLTNEDREEQLLSLNFNPITPNCEGKLLLPDSGYAVKLYEVLSESLKCTLLTNFCSEGDNRNDAISLLKLVQNIYNLNVKDDNIVIPYSWNFVYGQEPPVGMY